MEPSSPQPVLIDDAVFQIIAKFTSYKTYSKFLICCNNERTGVMKKFAKWAIKTLIAPNRPDDELWKLFRPFFGTYTGDLESVFDQIIVLTLIISNSIQISSNELVVLDYTSSHISVEDPILIRNFVFLSLANRCIVMWERNGKLPKLRRFSSPKNLEIFTKRKSTRTVITLNLPLATITPENVSRYVYPDISIIDKTTRTRVYQEINKAITLMIQTDPAKNTRNNFAVFDTQNKYVTYYSMLLSVLNYLQFNASISITDFGEIVFLNAIPRKLYKTKTNTSTNNIEIVDRDKFLIDIQQYLNDVARQYKYNPSLIQVTDDFVKLDQPPIDLNAMYEKYMFRYLFKK